MDVGTVLERVNTHGTRSICLAGCQMSVVMRAMENAYVINDDRESLLYPVRIDICFAYFTRWPGKDGSDEASIKSPFIAATGAIRLRE